MAPETSGDDFAERLSLALRAANMSGAQLSAAVGVDKSVVSRWLSGQVQPTSYNMARISAAIAKAHPGFNMTLWTAPRMQFEAAIGLTPPISGTPAPSAEATTVAAPSHPHVAPWTAAAGIALLLLAAGVLWMVPRTAHVPVSHPPAAAPVSASLAVMPFVNMSGDPSKEYLGDGIAEELLNDLSNTPNLQVASRTSAFSFKGKNADIGEIAQKLHVRAVVEGSTRQEGRRIRIVAQLIDGKSGFHLWSASYDRDLGDILAVQDEIARAIVAALTQKLLPQRAAKIVYHARALARINPDAYTAYLQGRYAENRSNAEEFLHAIALYKQAVKLQSDFVAAHAGLAMINWALFSNGERRDTLAAAKDETARTLYLDPKNLRALLVDAQIKTADWKWGEADSAMQRLLREYPNNAEVHFNYAVPLEALGLWEQSLRELRRAVELDPIVPGYRENIAGPLHYLGQENEAIAELRQVLSLDPDFMWAHADLCQSYVSLGKLNEAKRILRDRLMPRYGEDRHTLLCASFIAYRQHDTRELKRISQLEESLYARNGLSASWLCYPYAFAGDYENAMRWLEKAYDDRDANLFFTISDSDLPAALRKTSRWRKFARRPPFQEIARVREKILARDRGI